MMTKQKLVQTRAGQTRGLGSRSRRHRPPRERWEEARGGRRPRPTMEDPSASPDDAGQTTGRQSRRAGRDEGGSRTLRRSAGGCTKRLGAAGTRGTMWKTASASPPSGGRPRLVADHTHKEPCTKTAGRGPVPFYPSPSRGVRFIYLFMSRSARHDLLKKSRDVEHPLFKRSVHTRSVCVHRQLLRAIARKTTEEMHPKGVPADSR